MRPIRWIGLLMAMALLTGLAGCSSLSFVPERANKFLTLPPVQADGLTAPSGDSAAEYTRRFTLNYISSDQQTLLAVSRTMRMTSDDLLAEKVMERLLDPPDTLPSVLGIAPTGTKLLWIEQSEGIVTVNLSVDVLSLTEQELTWMRAAIANTLIGLDGIQHVNVLIGGKDESVLSLPTGSLGRTDGNLTALWAQQQADQERLNQASGQLERDVTLYFPASGGTYLLPVVRAIQFQNDNYALSLFRELAAGNAGTRILPEGEVLTAEPAIDTFADGRRVITLRLRGDFESALAQASISPALSYGALTLTLCRFVPEIDAMRILIGDQPLLSIDMGGRAITSEDGVYYPENFDSLIGSVAEVYLADAQNDGLQIVRRAMERWAALSPRVLIEQVLTGPRAGETDAGAVAPAGVSKSDIEGVRIEDGIALVNLSANFYRSCQNLSEQEERNLVYALVNTLCGLEPVEKVRFFIDGQTVDTLVTSICLSSTLMPNPGIVKG